MMRQLSGFHDRIPLCEQKTRIDEKCINDAGRMLYEDILQRRDNQNSKHAKI